MSEHAVSPIKTKKICFIDDSKTSAFVTKKMLTQYNYSVDHFPDAESALESLMEKDYALIITDLMISSTGGVNGDDLIRLIRQSGHPSKSIIPIIVVTGAGDQEALASLFAEGANSVLQKPLEGKVLHETIQSLIADEEDFTHVEEIENSTQAQNEVLADTLFTNPQVANKEVSSTNENKSPKEGLDSHEDNQNESVGASIESLLSTSTEDYATDSSIEKSEPKEDLIQNRKPVVEKTSASSLTASEIPVLTSIAKKTRSREKQPTQDSIHSAKPSSNKPTLDDIGSEIENLLKEDQEEKKSPENAPVASVVTGAALGNAPNKEPLAKHEATLSKTKKSADVSIESPDTVSSTSTKPLPSSNENDDDNPLLALLDHLDDPMADGIQKKFRTPLSFSFNPFSSGLPLSKLFLGLVFLVVIVPAISFLVLTQKVVEVKTMNVEVGPIHTQISLSGRVESKRRIKVSAREAGQLVSVSVKEGDNVAKKKTLAQLDDSEAKSNIKRAQARLLSIEEEVASTNKTQERLQRALDVGAVSRQMVENAEALWKSASAKQSVIEEELKSAELKRERLQIKAPFDGVITAVLAQEGQWVSQSEHLFTLVDMKQRVVKVLVDARDSANLSVGQTVVLRSGASQSLEWQEKIIKIGSSAKSRNSANVVKVTISFGDKAPDLKVGQQLDVEIRTESRTEAALLPYEALFDHNGRQTIAIIENGQIAFRTVETGIESFTRIEILSGIHAGEPVVIPEDIMLEPGMNAVSVGVYDAP